MRSNYRKQVGRLLLEDKKVNFNNVRDILCYNDLCPVAKCPFPKKGTDECNHILAVRILTNKVNHVIMGD
jgi:hypothetical protein